MVDYVCKQLRKSGANVVFMDYMYLMYRHGTECDTRENNDTIMLSSSSIK